MARWQARSGGSLEEGVEILACVEAVAPQDPEYRNCLWLFINRQFCAVLHAYSVEGTRLDYSTQYTMSNIGPIYRRLGLVLH